MFSTTIMTYAGNNGLSDFGGWSTKPDGQYLPFPAFFLYALLTVVYVDFQAPCILVSPNAVPSPAISRN